MSENIYCVIAGDSGVYSGWVKGGATALTRTGVIRIQECRHLRRYYVMGRTGDGSATDLARFGLDPSSPSVTEPVPGTSAISDVRRVFPVSEAAMASFGV